MLSWSMIEGYCSLDVRPLFRNGNDCGCVQWDHGASLGYWLSFDTARLTLDYSEGGIPAHESIALASTPCNYGGRRWWARCPGCSARVALLHKPAGKPFRCRRCYGLTYPVTREDTLARLFRRAHRCRRRLDGASDVLSPLPPRPPRMWHRTYQRLVSQAEQAQWDVLNELGIWTQNFAVS